MNKIARKLDRIQVTNNIFIGYGGGWFCLDDADWTEYGRSGAVVMPLDNLPALIAKLQELQTLLVPEVINERTRL